MSIMGLAISRPAPVAQSARLMSVASACGSAFSEPPIREKAAIMLATVPTSPRSGPIRTIVEIEPSRFSIPAITSL